MVSELKQISVVTACFNEEENVKELYEQVKTIFVNLPQYEYEHIFIDNDSKDRTVTILKEIAQIDHRVKIIVNTRNFGHIRSPFHALMQAKGAAVISIVADLQDPPIMIKEFIKKWEEGYKIVIGIKTQSEESPLFFAIRKAYYNLVGRLSDIELIKNFTGFGLYDQKVIETLRSIEDPYPYFRGLICDIGFERAVIEYVQPTRKRGFTKNNFYTLYDMAMLGITNHSKVPLRLATMTGFAVAILNLIVALGYFVYKLVFWNSFNVGIAPLVIGLFFFSSVQLFFIGIIGEYIGSVHTQVLKRPLVVEKERVNFD
ncbi:MAG: glycosyltransferase family 2 protein [Deltaproteobacteria bacterium]|nr:glycosyltransferase family 2 protein [Deltaproteobacteria bacterium]